MPVIAVDPKGDLGNLLLTFPNLAPEDFEPWIDPATALESGKTTQEMKQVIQPAIEDTAEYLSQFIKGEVIQITAEPQELKSE